MKQVEEKIRLSRPPLRKVAPLTFWISFGFVWTNIAIWILLTFLDNSLVTTVPVPTVVGPLSFELWGYYFLGLGLFLAYSLARNDWKKTRIALMLGFISKLLWSYSLIYMVYKGYNVYATTILWIFLAWTQGWTIVHFMPLAGANDKEDAKR